MVWTLSCAERRLRVAGPALEWSGAAAPASAHNWMHTPARSRKEASTTMPCRGRKATDTHAQLGPGQSTVLKWATGHTGDGGHDHTLLVVVHEDDYEWLRHESFLEFVHDYIDTAPSPAPGVVDPALAPATQRYHGVEGKHYDTFLTFIAGGQEGNAAGTVEFIGANAAGLGNTLFDGEVAHDDEHFLNHTFTATEHLYRYQPAVLAAGDKRVAYHNAKYPWLLAAHRYPHHYTRPGDYDAVRVEVPPRKGEGHYIVHYRWKGYSDCIDVDVFDEEVPFPDGQDEDAYVWNRVDHCQYVAPREVVTRCHMATGTPDKCVAELTGHRSERKCGTNCKTRYGINVVPYANPDAVPFPDAVNIPWTNHTCANTEWTAIAGTPSRSPVDWSRWLPRTAAHPGQKCRGDAPFNRQLAKGQGSSLRQAVMDCTRTTCAGISVLDAGGSLRNDGDLLAALEDDTRLFELFGCANDAADAAQAGGDGAAVAVDRSLKSATDWITFLKVDAAITQAGVGDYSGYAAAAAAAAEASAGGGALAPGEHDLAAVAAHGSGDDCWIAIDGFVYDVTEWFGGGHPGGMQSSACGTDASAAFNGQGAHAGVKPKGDRFRVGTLVAGPTPAPTDAPATYNGPVEVSFQPKGASVQLPGSVVPDVGEAYGDRGNGLRYGWTCDIEEMIDPSGAPFGKHRVPYLKAGGKGIDVLTHMNTAVRDVHMGFCPPAAEGGSPRRNVWEFALPPGYYKVTTTFSGWQNNGRIGSCAIEGVALATVDKVRIQYTGDNTYHASHRLIELADGRLTFSAENGHSDNRRCKGVASIRVEKLDRHYAPAWIPSSPSTGGGAWYQLELPDDTEPVGLVSILLPHRTQRGGNRKGTFNKLVDTDCRVGWQLGAIGDACAEGLEYTGWIEPGRGAAVTVSDVPCTADGRCPGSAATVTCGVANRVPFDGTSRQYYPSWIDCRKATGKYLRVHLPGPRRIFDASVVVNRARPAFANKPATPYWAQRAERGAPESDAMVCYGVIARAFEDESTPEFVITDDPLDPKFYSTCYVRERAVTFLPPPGSGGVSLTGNGTFSGGQNETTTYTAALDDSSRTHPWAFHGRCLSCDNYDENRPPQAGTTATPRWRLGAVDSCSDCASGDDLGTAACSANYTAPEGLVDADAFSRRASGRCAAPFDADADACFAAVDGLRPAGGAAPRTATGAAADVPPGCSMVVGDNNAVVAAFFNTADDADVECGNVGPVGGAAAAEEAAAAAAEFASDANWASVQTSVGVFVNVSIDAAAGKADITVAGPNRDVWFGVGFGATEMADEPWVLIVDPDGGVTERKIGYYVKGTLLSPSVEVLEVEKLVLAQGPSLRVKVRRDLARVGKKYFDFSAGARDLHMLPVIVAVGWQARFGRHASNSRATTRLTRGGGGSGERPPSDISGRHECICPRTPCAGASAVAASLEACRAARGPFAWTCDDPLLDSPCPEGQAVIDGECSCRA